MSGNRVLEARGVSVVGPSGPVVAGLDLSVDSGEAVAITGGGTTDLGPVLRVLGALEAPAAGEVSWGAASSRVFDLPAFSPARYRVLRDLRTRIGLVTPGGPLLQNLTTRENIALPIEYHAPVDSRRAVARVSRTIELLDLAGAAGRRPARLSRGERLRAQIARALVLEPDLLLLESPLVDMDRATVDTILGALGSVRSERPLAIVVSTYEPIQVLPVVRRVVVIDDNRVAGILAASDFSTSGLSVDMRRLLDSLERRDS